MSESSAINRFMQFIGGLAFSRIVIFALVLTGLYYTMIYDSGEAILKSIASAKNQLETENRKKLETQKVLKKEQQMKADVELFAKKFEEIKARIPIEFSEAELRSIVNQYSTRNGLKTTRTERRQLTSAVNAPHAASTGENLVEQIALLYEFEGSYSNISKFITEIANLQKIIKIGDFNMSLVVNNNNTKLRGTDISFKATIIGYKQSLESTQTAEKKVTP